MPENGSRTPPRPRFPTVDPATGKPGPVYDGHTLDEARAIVGEARFAWEGWRKTDFDLRSQLMHEAARVLRRRSDELCALMTAEMGKTLTEGRAEIEKCAQTCEVLADRAEDYLRPMPVEIDEAGRVDGLTPFGTFWRLVLPLSRPGLGVTVFYSFLTAWSEVAYATQFLGSDHYTLAVGIRTFAADQRADWALLTAASVIIAIPATAVFLLVQRHLVSGLTAGGTKS